MATTALKMPGKLSLPAKAPSAPETDKAIEAVVTATSPEATANALAERVVIFRSYIPSFIFREGGRHMQFSNGIYKATGDEILLLRHAASRAWWLEEVVNLTENFEA